MQVSVFAGLRDVLGTKQLDVPIESDTSVREVLLYLVQEHPQLGLKLLNAEGALTGYVTVMVNGRSVNFLSGLDTPVKPGDSLALFPPIGGG